MKKKKKIIRLAVSFVVLLALIGGYVAMTVMFPKEEESSEQEDNKINVVKMNESDFRKITYSQDGESIELVYDEGTEKWSTTNDADCPVDNYKVSNMIDTMCDLDSTTEIKGDDIDEESFGLNNPSKTIDVVLEDGTERKFVIGGYNDVVDKYYFTKDDSDSVYLIDSTLYNTMDYNLLRLAEVESYPTVAEQDLYEISLTKDGKTTYVVDNNDAAHKKNDGTIPDCEWLSGSSLDKVSKASDKDKMSEFITGICGLSNSETVTYKKTEADMKKYGLETPKTLKLTVKYTEMKSNESESDELPQIIDKSFTVYVGGKDKKSGEYYVMMDGSKAIYTMNVSKVESLLGVLE
ncbi:MAG: DUF4340 domain-containing protein [Lachnospiraceae bacterium]|nr:DUF4340 domain-containing protein [Lachnospiraceae bacterium]